MIISIISSVVIWGAAAVIMLRVLNTSGISMQGNKYTAWLTADKSLKSGFEIGKREILYVFLLTFAFRVIIFLLSIVIMGMFRDKPLSGFNDILEEYMKWDSNNYVRIATGGYTYHVENGDFTTLAFFPLYPWLMRIVNLVFRDLRVSGLILSSALYSGACCYLYKLLSLDYNRDTAKRAIIYLSVFPHALFFGTLMNESMLLFTSVATLYYIRKHNWMLVGIFGALAAMSRAIGIMLAIPAAVEWLEEYRIFEKIKNKDFKTVWKLFYSKGLWIFLMLLGTGVYLFCNYKTSGNWFKFLEYQQKYWNHKSTYFGIGIGNLFGRLTDDNQTMLLSVYLPSVISLIFVICTLVYGLRRGRSMYGAYLIAYIIVNMSVDWIISTPRYMTCAVPAFIFLADFSERHKWTEPLITGSKAVGMGIYLVGYLLWKQIL